MQYSDRWSCWFSSVEIIRVPDVPKKLIGAFRTIGYRNEFGQIIDGAEAVTTLSAIWQFCKAQDPWQLAAWCEFGKDFPDKPYKRLKIHWRKTATGELYPASPNTVRVDLDGSIPSWDHAYTVTVNVPRVGIVTVMQNTYSQCLKFVEANHNQTLTFQGASKTYEVSGSRLRMECDRPTLTVISRKRKRA